ncbi:DNA polymerase-3 subunit epsilon [Algoriphagus boseongensis]|uniref:DNA polymerase-3 subunit epsilon n=1 Tax=Algoriphagus boseongensis TaxID=1442587 RepID=A0A4R6T702_9BACT|nr:3'-5' exonuclease [Algoriphagus boseongensis]TDQ17336.1 DNA polymerase-3 subunit epsilon [Algoriphagus boseongensis]
MSWWKLGKKSNPKKDFVKEFLLKNEDKIPDIRRIDQLEFVVLDTETSGLNPEKDQILSFGAVKIWNLKIMVSESLELYPMTNTGFESSAKIHGMVGAESRIDLEEFGRELLQFLGNGILVGHHIGFDLEMLLKSLTPFGLDRFPNPVIDTLNLAIRLEHGPMADWNQINQNDYSLDRLCTKFGIEPDDRHTAAGDALLTAQLFQKLLFKAKQKGIENFSELVR